MDVNINNNKLKTLKLLENLKLYITLYTQLDSEKNKKNTNSCIISILNCREPLYTFALAIQTLKHDIT